MCTACKPRVLELRFCPSQLFSIRELQDQIYGNERLEAKHFKDLLVFAEDVNEDVQSHFRKYLDGADESELRALLRFITGTENFGAVGCIRSTENNIKVAQVSADRLPFARTCIRTIDLPNESDYSAFKSKLQDALHQCIQLGHGAFLAE